MACKIPNISRWAEAKYDRFHKKKEKARVSNQSAGLSNRIKKENPANSSHIQASSCIVKESLQTERL